MLSETGINEITPKSKTSAFHADSMQLTGREAVAWQQHSCRLRPTSHGMNLPEDTWKLQRSPEAGCSLSTMHPRLSSQH